MSPLERFYKIDQLLHARGVVPRAAFLDALEVSLATFKRDLLYMRDRLNAPVIWDGDAGGYRYAGAGGKGRNGPTFELPGLWFNQQEVHALVMMQQLLASLDQGGLIGPHIAPLMARLDAILGAGEAPTSELRKRIKLLSSATRQMPLEHFSMVGSALIKRRRLAMAYYAKSTDRHTTREVSPQRLVHYRENWYLDAWCHLRNGLRSFALDGIRQLELVDAPAKEVSLRTLDGYLLDSYGIVHGGERKRAILRFSAERARWVAAEVWHPEQTGRFDEQKRYVLDLPYSDDRELVMDILRHGAEVELLEPADLRSKVRDMHEKSAQIYRTNDERIQRRFAKPGGVQLPTGARETVRDLALPADVSGRDGPKRSKR
jgi:predicted DNA-binding transcriptional regulator YafY